MQHTHSFNKIEKKKKTDKRKDKNEFWKTAYMEKEILTKKKNDTKMSGSIFRKVIKIGEEERRDMRQI